MIVDEVTLRRADGVAARYLRDARVRAGITAAEAAEAAGIDKSDLEAWEAGTRSADAIVALALLKWYGADGMAMLNEIDEVIRSFQCGTRDSMA